MKPNIYVTDIDTLYHVAHTDEGEMLPIEDYGDEYENPCLPEEARYVFVRTGEHHYHRLEILQAHYDEDY